MPGIDTNRIADDLADVAAQRPNTGARVAQLAASVRQWARNQQALPGPACVEHDALLEAADALLTIARQHPGMAMAVEHYLARMVDALEGEQ